MGHQRYPYLKLKGSTYYYTRRIPKALHHTCGFTRFEACLHTSSASSAIKQSMLLSQELEDHWSILRRRLRNDRIAKLFGAEARGIVHGVVCPEGHKGPLLSTALETYLSLKGSPNRPKTFETSARRSIGYLLEVVDDKPIDAFERQDANALRDYLKERGMAQDSISRNFTNVKAIINFASKEHGLQATEVFSGVYLGEPAKPTKRYVPTADELLRLRERCIRQDDELRWALGLLMDTGMRLSEALGLARTDVFLDHEHPHLLIRPHPWRRLKTSASERTVPLVGMALWSAQRAIVGSRSEFMFPRYIRGRETLSNSASAALNKWLKSNVHDQIVVHSLRHAIRDRLRSVECPPDIIDAIGGWSREGVGEGYGKGHTLETTFKWLVKISLETYSGAHS